MANTVTIDSGGVISVVPDGSTNLDLATYFPNGIYLRDIHFKQSDPADVLYIRIKDVSGVQLIPNGLAGRTTYAGLIGDAYHEILPKRRFLFMKAADCTFTTPANCLIQIYFD